MDRLGNRTNQFIGFSLPERQFRYFALFGLVLDLSKLELHSVSLLGFMTLLGRL